jgi:cbb3-type cytochrome oxidase maturation protein
MSVIAVLIVCSVCVAGGFLAAFLWAVRSGQFADKYTPSVRMLFDDAPPQPTPESPNHIKEALHDQRS